MTGERSPTGARQAMRPNLEARPPRLPLASGSPPAGLVERGAAPPLPAEYQAKASSRAPAPPGDTARIGTGGAGHGMALPGATAVLAVIARPGQESAGLGAILSAYRLGGARLAVLCLTRGEASERNSTADRLEAVRPWELQVAAGLLGVSSVTVADYPDGRLGYVPVSALTELIRRAVLRIGADLLLVVDPAAVADPDTAAVAAAASLAAREVDLAVLARTVPGPGARWPVDLGQDAAAVRACQRQAVDAHVSQRGPERAGREPDAAAGEDGGQELVRWLLAPRAAVPRPVAPREMAPRRGAAVAAV